MITDTVIISLAVQAAIPLLITLAAFFYLRKKEQIPLVPLGVGALIFIVFSQVLEKLLHHYVFFMNPAAAEALKAPLTYALYGALAAGVFEEAGRYAAFRFLLRRRRERRDGLAYGLGHGGVEALLIGTVAAVQMLTMALMIKNGQFDAIASGMPAGMGEAIRQQLQHVTPGMSLLSAGERLMALIFQLALSLLVLYAVRSGKLRFLALAVAWHALPDFFAALFQKQAFPFWGAELVLIAVTLLSLLFLRRSRRLFPG